MKLGAWCACAIGWLLAGVAFATVVPDTISDQVGATAGQFRVDESGAATYAIPIFTPPGTAGVAPQVALAYSSQGGEGPLGKGWAISGLSGINRCRATREAGDFISSGVPVDGDPQPINFTASDRFCLDGQRLITAPASAAVCKALSGATVSQYRGEIDSQQRVCGYAFDASGPRFFTVERKDGSTSWFGDRRDTTGGLAGAYPNGVLAANGTAQTSVLSWAITRSQDSTGNYIDYSYAINPTAGYPGEQHVSRIAWTGKNQLPGQSAPAQTPTQWIDFTYSQLASIQFSRSYASGSQLWQTQQLDSVTVTAGTQVVRHYALTHQQSVATHALVLSQLQECTDASKTICLAPTTFTLTAGVSSFDTADSNSTSDFTGMVSYKIGDVDGDGRQDIVWLKQNDPGCSTWRVYVSYGELDSAGRLTFNRLPQAGYCIPQDMSAAPHAWNVFDYDGDGREDILIPIATSWSVLRSNGRPVNGGEAFNSSNNLIGALSPSIPALTNGSTVPNLADLNGDGQLDVVYKTSVGSTLAARLAERRADGSWGWGAERALYVQVDSSDPCYSAGDCVYRNFSGATGGLHLNDFDGDSRADLLIKTSVSNGYCAPAPGAIRRLSRMHTDSTAADSPSSGCNHSSSYLQVMTVQSIAAGVSGAITVHAIKSWDNSAYTDFRFADVNGDGVTDILANNSRGWTPFLNDGTGYFAALQSPLTVPNAAAMQLVDVNGDGRADLVYPGSTTGGCAFVAQLAQPDGTFAAQSALPGGRANACNNSDLTTNPWAQIFADFDGDGTVDYVRLNLQAAGIYTSRATTLSRFQPHDLIQIVVNGYGAITRMLYTPLTNAAVYRPDNGSRNSQTLASYGRGSPIVDLLAPMYVVGYVESSAPVFNNPAALSYVYYRYAGAKMQGGGRGFLGFREISTVDANQSGHYVATTTDYRQDFPFIGSPSSTVKTVVNGNYASDVCLTGIVSANASGNACFKPPGNPFSAFAGINVSQNTQVWEASPAFAAGVQQPMQVRTMGTEEILRDLASSAITSDVGTSFSYNGFGDVTDTVVDTYADADITQVAEVKTVNTYVDDEASWRLGRLMTSTVTHTRNGSSIARKTAFTYDMASAAKTGLLLSEQIQPPGPPNRTADQDRKTVYTLDDYGNRLSTTTCSYDIAIASCGTSGVNFHPVNGASPSLNVQRYSRTTYDNSGHYPVATFEPFWSGTATIEMQTQQVNARDALGNVLQAVNAKGVQTMAVPGRFGRLYYTWAQTVIGAQNGDAASGAESWTTYRWCAGSGRSPTVSCPNGAAFRQRVVAEGAPTKWTYFDVLGRPLLAVGQSFNTGLAGQEFAGVCTYSDAVGRSERTSNPFFLSDPSSAGDPSFASQTDPCGIRNWAVTTFDVLSRPTLVVFADTSSVSSVYTGLTTTSTDQLNHHTVVVKNALGEKVSVTDSANLTTTYAYDAAGDLATVSRDGGRGAIVTSYTYDALGRKLSQTDGDTGTYRYTYNAAGELLTQTDAKGQQIRSDYDARGRVWRKRAYTLTGGALALESTSQFNFDYDANVQGLQSLGGLVSESMVNATPGSTDNMTRGYSYDTLGRPVGKSHLIDGNLYSEVMVYDTLGRVQESQDATGHWLRTQYRGAYAQAQCEGSSTNPTSNSCAGLKVYVQTLATDNWGHAVSETRGAVTTTRGFDPLNGRLLGVCSLAPGQQSCGSPVYCTSSSCPLQDETYTWDLKGNLTSRSRGATYTENFRYDANDRLLQGWYTVLGGTSYALAAPSTINAANNTEWMRYDPLGNLCERSGSDGVYRQYTYAQLGGCGLAGLPGGVTAGTVNSGYRLLQAAGETFTTDANGSMTLAQNSSGATLRGWNYDSQNRAVDVYKGASPTMASLRTRWDYDASGARFRRTDDGTGGPSSTTLYLDNVERVTTGGNVTWRRTIAGVAVMALTGSTPGLVNNIHSLLHDHIGSVVAVADTTSGALIERGDYSAFGGMRTASNNGISLGLAALSTTTRGFTGHEQLGNLDLIHMNGRIYDPALGRFLQADPMVAEPGNPQNWNPYSYVFNNPLANTDPTGMFSWRQALGIVIGAVAAFFGQYYITAKLWAAAALCFIGGGFVAGYVTSGTVKGGVYGAFAGLLTFGISGSGIVANYFENILAQGTSGGIMESLQGGNFGHGFLVAGLGAAVTPAIGDVGNSVGRVIASSLVGGTISDLTGGKFADGAASWAIQAATQEGLRAGAKPQGQFVYPSGGKHDPNAYNTLFIGGANQDISVLTQAVNRQGDAFGYYLPTQGNGAPDIFRTIAQKFFGWSGDSLAADLVAGLSSVDHPLSIVPFSEGTITTVNAQLYSGGLPHGSTFFFNSPVVSGWAASAAVNSNGGYLGSYNLPPGDIANLIAPGSHFFSGFHDLFCGFCVHTSTQFDH